MSEKHPTLFDEDQPEGSRKTISELREMVDQQRRIDHAIRLRSESYAKDRINQDEQAKQKALEGGIDTSSKGDATSLARHKRVEEAKAALRAARDRSNPANDANDR